MSFPTRMHGEEGPPPRERDRSQVNLPESFWNARPGLQQIRQIAHARCAPADAVLACIMARIGAMVPPGLRVDTGIGKVGLNWFTTLCGPSGSGKSSSFEVATDVLNIPGYLQTKPLDPAPFRDGVSVGSGEGVPELYMGYVLQETGELDRKGEPKTEKIRAQVREHALIYIDEGQQLTQLLERAGSTVGPTLRSAWGGGTLGSSSGRAETTRVIERGRYSLGVVIGYQPGTAQALLADDDAGTPQRFQWTSATDPTVPDVMPEWPGSLTVPLEFYGEPIGGYILMDDAIRSELWARKLARARGEAHDDPLASHEPVWRAKAAALLALLDGGSTVVSLADWELSWTLWETSCAVRDSLIEHGKAEEAEKAQRRADAARQQAVQTAAEVDQVSDKVARLARRLADRVAEEGGLTSGAAKQTLRSTDRFLFDAVTEKAATEGWVRAGSGGLLPPLRAV